LRLAQIEFLKKNFAPTEKAPATLREDFQKWQNEAK
jgi:hypothetical protein